MGTLYLFRGSLQVPAISDCPHVSFFFQGRFFEDALS